MSDNKFTESMEVIEIGTMRLCDSVPVCANFTDVTGVLIEGITKEAAKLLYEKVEIMPVGTKAKMAELEASNAELLEALEDCCVIAKPGNPSSCCPVYRPGEHGGCSENEDGECHIWKAIQKAMGYSNE